jgi:Ca-activated chloride channel homolog
MFCLALLAASALTFQGQAVPGPAVDPGSLQIIGKDGAPGAVCPLKGTQVGAKIEGFGARVIVVQTFSNPTSSPIEAIYTFPLPQDSSVDGMRMIIGKRVIDGVIKKRADARATYEQAKQQGKSTALLDQERPNIFTQSVANIPAHAQIQVAITYVQLLKFENDEFEFVFPMVVGHRYTGTSTPDPGKVVPEIVPPGTRSGSTIQLNVEIDAGAPITEMHSVLHQVNTKKVSDRKAMVQLAKADEIPNRDFILRYSISTDTVVSSLLTHTDSNRGGFFTLIIMPPKAPMPEQVAAKEAILVVDQSGSQRGFPLEKSKEMTIKVIKALNPDDTFNIVNFSTNFKTLWDKPRPNTEANREEAIHYVEVLDAVGGTELEKAVVAALSPPPDPARPRVVIFNTDGFIGGEAKALEEIQLHRGNARMFTFGIGNSVNRYLVEAMSVEGRGDYEVVTLNADADAAVARLVQRTDSPVLTDIKVEFEGVAVHDTLPRFIPDVFSEKPVIIKGRYDKPGNGYVIVSGNLGGKPWRARYPVVFPGTGNTGSAIASIWAREKVNDLELQERLETIWGRKERGSTEDKKFWENSITDLALDFGIMTKYTSFVAVDHNIVNPGGKQQTIKVPVDMADGVSYEGIFGVRLKGGSSQAEIARLKEREKDVNPAMAANLASRVAGGPGAGQSRTKSLASGRGGAGGGATLTGQGVKKLGKSAPIPSYGGGDPLLTVDAPATSKVVALFPGGDLKPMKWNAAEGKWEIRFDIPISFKEGTYTIQVHIVNADGTRRTMDVPFDVALTAPDLHPTSQKLDAATISIQLDSDPRWARIALLTPWNDRLEMNFDAATGKISLKLHLPKDFAGGWFRMIGLDRAHNKSEVRLYLNEKGEIEKIEPVR